METTQGATVLQCISNCTDLIIQIDEVVGLHEARHHSSRSSD